MQVVSYEVFRSNSPIPLNETLDDVSASTVESSSTVEEVSQETEEVTEESSQIDDSIMSYSETVPVCSYQAADLAGIEQSLQLITCLLIVLVLFNVLRLCKYIVETIL